MIIRGGRMDELNEQVEKLYLTNRISRVLARVMVVLCVAALLLAIWGKNPFGIILLVVSLGVLVVSRYIGCRYTQDAAAANLRYGLAGSLEAFSYQASGGVADREFRAWSLLPVEPAGRHLLSRNTFSGWEGALELAGSEITFHYKTANGGRVGYRFLSGTLLTARTMVSHRHDEWLLLSETLAKETEIQRFLEEEDYQPVEVPIRGCRLYAKEEQFLSGEDLSRLANVPEAVTALRLTNGGAAAYLNGRFYTGSHYPSARPTPERLRENTLPQRDEVWSLFRWWLSPPNGDDCHL